MKKIEEENGMLWTANFWLTVFITNILCMFSITNTFFQRHSFRNALFVEVKIVGTFVTEWKERGCNMYLSTLSMRWFLSWIIIIILKT